MIFMNDKNKKDKKKTRKDNIINDQKTDLNGDKTKWIIPIDDKKNKTKLSSNDKNNTMIKDQNKNQLEDSKKINDIIKKFQMVTNISPIINDLFKNLPKHLKFKALNWASSQAIDAKKKEGEKDLSKKKTAETNGIEYNFTHKNFWLSFNINNFINKINSKVAGQWENIKILCILIYDHYYNWVVLNNRKNVLKNNILCFGPTGCGKTFILTTILNELKIPFVIADATVFTPSGIVGSDVQNVFFELVTKSNNDLKKAELGIIIFDEIDKLSLTETHEANTVDRLKLGTQQSLLKVMEGSIIEKNVTPRDLFIKNVSAPKQVNTSNMLFIALGYFKDVDLSKEQYQLGMSIYKEVGKTNDFNLKHDLAKENLMHLDHLLKKNKRIQENLINVGFLKELVGRFLYFIKFNRLSKKDLKNIILNIQDPILYSSLLSIAWYLNIPVNSITIDDKIINNIVDDTYNNSLGAWGLKQLITSIIIHLKKEIFLLKKQRESKINKIHITIDERSCIYFKYH